MSFHNLFTGTTQGAFDLLRVRDASGQMVDVLTLVGGGGGGGGGGIVNSVTLPLAITGGVLSIDLSTYSNTAAINAMLASYALTASLFAGVAVGAGLLAVSGNGTLSLALDGQESRSALKLQDSIGTVRQLASSLTGALVWNGAQLVNINDLGAYTDTAGMNTALALKEDVLSFYSETQGTQTTVLQTFDDATPVSTHLAWPSGTYTNVSNSHQVVTAGCYTYFASMGTEAVNFTVQLQADSVSSIVFSINDSTGWVGAAEVQVTGLGATWQTLSWSFAIPSNGQFSFHAGIPIPGGPYTQPAGAIKLKNMHLFKTTSFSSISQPLSVTGDVTSSSVMRATSFTSTSDASIKEQVRDASLDDCMSMLKAVDLKTYTRTDLPGQQRLGFIAQDVQAKCPPEWGNVVNTEYGGSTPLLSLSYDRLACVLWGVCKVLDARLAALEQA